MDSVLLNDVIGQKAAVLKARGFVERFRKGRALLLYGPSGTGKTLIARAVADEYGMELVEIDASDKRSEKAINELLMRAIGQASLTGKRKLILVDELEGLSSGDRGAVSAIVKIIKQSSYPIILTARNPYTQKLLPLRNACDLMEIKKLTAVSIEKHLAELGCKNAKEIAESANGDMRAALIDFRAHGHSREVQENVFATLRTMFKANSIESSRKAIANSEASTEQLFWWVENNIATEFKKHSEIAEAFDLLSRTDVMRRRGNITNMLASFCAIRRYPDFSFVSYRAPRMFFGRKKNFSEEAAELHCSQKKIRSDHTMKLLLG